MLLVSLGLLLSRFSGSPRLVSLVLIVVGGTLLIEGWFLILSPIGISKPAWRRRAETSTPGPTTIAFTDKVLAGLMLGSLLVMAVSGAYLLIFR